MFFWWSMSMKFCHCCMVRMSFKVVNCHLFYIIFLRAVVHFMTKWKQNQLEMHSVEHIYLRQQCFNTSKPHVAASTGAQHRYMGFSRRNKIPHCIAQYGFSWHNKIPRCSAYTMGGSNPVLASGLWSRSGSEVSQFVHVPTSDICRHATFHPNPCTRFWVILHTDRQSNERGRACENIYLLCCQR